MTKRTSDGSSPDASWPDDQLVSECLAGDQRAWSALIEKYKKLVYSVPAKYQLPPEEAADIFQHVWADLYRDLGRLERVEGLRGWLITAAARRCLLHKKRRQKMLNMAGLDPNLADQKPDAAAIHAEAVREQKIRDAIERLPIRCKKLVGMLFFEQPPLPYSEVARSLGLAEGSIGFIRGRCLKKLRTLIVEMDL
jgi:RNA polymerase sigma factor (sigma-70 family)